MASPEYLALRTTARGTSMEPTSRETAPRGGPQDELGLAAGRVNDLYFAAFMLRETGDVSWRKPLRRPLIGEAIRMANAEGWPRGTRKWILEMVELALDEQQYVGLRGVLGWHWHRIDIPHRKWRQIQRAYEAIAGRLVDWHGRARSGVRAGCRE